MTEAERRAALETFFYLLARDELPLGKIERIIQEVDILSGRGVTVFTSDEIHAYAVSCVERLIGGEDS